MAIKNLEKIKQIGNQKKEEKRIAMDIKRNNFNSLVLRIRALQNDAIDAMDTIAYLQENGLGNLFEDWNKSTPIYFDGKSFTIGYYDNVGEEERRKSTIKIGYSPSENELCFSWNGWGMCELYHSDEYIFSRVWEKPRYKGGLEKFAIVFESWLKNFFAWVDNL